MAVMSARSIARRLVNIQHLNSLHLQAVDEMRRDVVKTTVNALVRRYKEHQKYEEPCSFIDWLVKKQHLENTFKVTTYSLATRRRWAISYFNFFVRKELKLADDPYDQWMFDALEEALNAKNDDPDWMIVIETVDRKEIPQHKLKAGVSFMFRKEPATNSSNTDMAEAA